MPMKAALVQQRTPGVFDKETGRSIGFARCLHEARSAARLKLTEEEAGTLTAEDAMRDDEQQWFTVVDEGLLYFTSRSDPLRRSAVPGLRGATRRPPTAACAADRL